MNRRLDAFQKLAVTTTVVTYLLVMVGGIVRATGAGMGCPDWPKCFGLWVPPTRAEQLPAGFNPALFDAALTWTEYLNRLLGVATGFLIFATLIAAFVKHRRTRGVFWPALGAFIGVGYEGWLGGRVVAHELAPWIVTAHLLGALVVVALLLYATVSAFVPGDRPLASVDASHRRLSLVGAALLLLTLAQLGVGTQVRGFLDDLARHAPDAARFALLPRLGTIDIAHRQLALVVLVAALAAGALVLRRHRASQPLVVVAYAIVALTFAQIFAGLFLVYIDMKPMMMVAHLTIGSLLLGAETLLVVLPLRLAGPAPAPGSRSSLAAAQTP